MMKAMSLRTIAKMSKGKLTNEILTQWDSFLKE